MSARLGHAPATHAKAAWSGAGSVTNAFDIRELALGKQASAS
jgi:hypothetical protein